MATLTDGREPFADLVEDTEKTMVLFPGYYIREEV